MLAMSLKVRFEAVAASATLADRDLQRQSSDQNDRARWALYAS
jgi:hypothetical protein